MYLFYAHIGFNGDLVPIAKLNDVWPVALILPFACILLAWICWRFYDRPVRRYFMKASKNIQQSESSANSDDSI
jgi:peptidoglycan/LPS O-acetylase OafA/YrhL